MTTTDKNRPATIVGCGIGDALGFPFEMKSAKSAALQEWDGLFAPGGTFMRNSKPGQFSDDTLMTIQLAKSLIEVGHFDGANVAQKYLDWYNSGNTRGIGSTTAEALVHLRLGASWLESGVMRDKCDGNGTLMRVSALALLYRNDLKALVEAAAQDASITHNRPEPIAGSIAGALATAHLLNGTPPNEIIEAIIESVPVSSVRWNMGVALDNLEDDEVDPAPALEEIGVSGYVPHTIGAALYCIAKTENFKDAVMMAVRGGGDADSTASVVGAMAGSYYGMNGIPDEYKTVEDYDLLVELTDKLYVMGAR